MNRSTVCPSSISTCQTATVILADSGARVRNILETIMRDEEQLARLEGILATRKEQTLRQVGGFLRGHRAGLPAL